MPKLIRKAESCESCGRDLPIGEICQFCGYDNHQLVLGGYACKRIRNEIKVDKKIIVTQVPLWKIETKDGKEDK